MDAQLASLQLFPLTAAEEAWWQKHHLQNFGENENGGADSGEQEEGFLDPKRWGVVEVISFWEPFTDKDAWCTLKKVDRQLSPTSAALYDNLLETSTQIIDGSLIGLVGQAHLVATSSSNPKAEMVQQWLNSTTAGGGSIDGSSTTQQPQPGNKTTNILVVAPVSGRQSTAVFRISSLLNIYPRALPSTESLPDPLFRQQLPGLLVLESVFLWPEVMILQEAFQKKQQQQRQQTGVAGVSDGVETGRGKRGRSPTSLRSSAVQGRTSSSLSGSSASSYSRQDPTRRKQDRRSDKNYSYSRSRSSYSSYSSSGSSYDSYDRSESRRRRRRRRSYSSSSQSGRRSRDNSQRGRRRTRSRGSGGGPPAAALGRQVPIVPAPTTLPVGQRVNAPILGTSPTTAFAPQHVAPAHSSTYQQQVGKVQPLPTQQASNNFGPVVDGRGDGQPPVVQDGWGDDTAADINQGGSTFMQMMMEQQRLLQPQKKDLLRATHLMLATVKPKFIEQLTSSSSFSTAAPSSSDLEGEIKKLVESYGFIRLVTSRSAAKASASATEKEEENGDGAEFFVVFDSPDDAHSAIEAFNFLWWNPNTHPLHHQQQLRKYHKGKKLPGADSSAVFSQLLELQYTDKKYEQMILRKKFTEEEKLRKEELRELRRLSDISSPIPAPNALPAMLKILPLISNPEVSTHEIARRESEILTRSIWDSVRSVLLFNLCSGDTYDSPNAASTLEAAVLGDDVSKTATVVEPTEKREEKSAKKAPKSTLLRGSRAVIREKIFSTPVPLGKNEAVTTTTPSLFLQWSEFDKSWLLSILLNPTSGVFVESPTCLPVNNNTQSTTNNKKIDESGQLVYELRHDFVTSSISRPKMLSKIVTSLVERSLLTDGRTPPLPFSHQQCLRPIPCAKRVKLPSSRAFAQQGGHGPSIVIEEWKPVMTRNLWNNVMHYLEVVAARRGVRSTCAAADDCPPLASPVWTRSGVLENLIDPSVFIDWPQEDRLWLAEYLLNPKIGLFEEFQQEITASVDDTSAPRRSAFSRAPTVSKTAPPTKVKILCYRLKENFSTVVSLPHPPLAHLDEQEEHEWLSYQAKLRKEEKEEQELELLRQQRREADLKRREAELREAEAKAEAGESPTLGGWTEVNVENTNTDHQRLCSSDGGPPVERIYRVVSEVESSTEKIKQQLARCPARKGFKNKSELLASYSTLLSSRAELLEEVRNCHAVVLARGSAQLVGGDQMGGLNSVERCLAPLKAEVEMRIEHTSQALATKVPGSNTKLIISLSTLTAARSDLFDELQSIPMKPTGEEVSAKVSQQQQQKTVESHNVVETREPQPVQQPVAKPALYKGPKDATLVRLYLCETLNILRRSDKEQISKEIISAELTAYLGSQGVQDDEMKRKIIAQSILGGLLQPKPNQDPDEKHALLFTATGDKVKSLKTFYSRWKQGEAKKAAAAATTTDPGKPPLLLTNDDTADRTLVVVPPLPSPTTVVADDKPVLDYLKTIRPDLLKDPQREISKLDLCNALSKGGSEELQRQLDTIDPHLLAAVSSELLSSHATGKKSYYTFVKSAHNLRRLGLKDGWYDDTSIVRYLAENHADSILLMDSPPSAPLKINVEVFLKKGNGRLTGVMEAALLRAIATGLVLEDDPTISWKYSPAKKVLVFNHMDSAAVLRVKKMKEHFDSVEALAKAKRQQQEPKQDVSKQSEQKQPAEVSKIKGEPTTSTTSTTTLASSTAEKATEAATDQKKQAPSRVMRARSPSEPPPTKLVAAPSTTNSLAAPNEEKKAQGGNLTSDTVNNALGTISPAVLAMANAGGLSTAQLQLLQVPQMTSSSVATPTTTTAGGIPTGVTHSGSGALVPPMATLALPPGVGPGSTRFGGEVAPIGLPPLMPGAGGGILSFEAFAQMMMQEQIRQQQLKSSSAAGASPTVATTEAVQTAVLPPPASSTNFDTFPFIFDGYLWPSGLSRKERKALYKMTKATLKSRAATLQALSLQQLIQNVSEAKLLIDQIGEKRAVSPKDYELLVSWIKATTKSSTASAP